MRRSDAEPDPAEQASTVDSPQKPSEPTEPGVEAEAADHPLLGLGLAIETYHRGVT